MDVLAPFYRLTGRVEVEVRWKLLNQAKPSAVPGPRRQATLLPPATSEPEKPQFLRWDQIKEWQVECTSHAAAGQPALAVNPFIIGKGFRFPLRDPVYTPRCDGDRRRLGDGIMQCSRGVLAMLEADGGLRIEVVFFDTFARFPRVANWENLVAQGKKRPNKQDEYYQALYVASGRPYAMSIHPVGLTTGDPRFQRKTQMGAAMIRAATLGEVLNPLPPLEPAYDPDYEFLDPGVKPNALTDGGLVSIPLKKPVDWSSEKLDRCRSLRGVPRASWRSLILFLTGKRGVGIDHLVELEHRDGEDELEAREERDGELTIARAGACYGGEFISITLVGTNIVFKVQGAHGIWWIVDSMEWGVGLRIFDNPAHAMAWARGGEARKRVKLITDFCQRAYQHDPAGVWRTRVPEFLRDNTPRVFAPPPSVPPVPLRPVLENVIDPMFNPA